MKHDMSECPVRKNWLRDIAFVVLADRVKFEICEMGKI
jgi:hypothetical protein